MSSFHREAKCAKKCFKSRPFPLVYPSIHEGSRKDSLYGHLIVRFIARNERIIGKDENPEQLALQLRLHHNECPPVKRQPK
jgi:hypothetical protein